MREVVGVNDGIVERVVVSDVQLAVTERMLQRRLDSEASRTTLGRPGQREQQLDLTDLRDEHVRVGFLESLVTRGNSRVGGRVVRAVVGV